MNKAWKNNSKVTQSKHNEKLHKQANNIVTCLSIKLFSIIEDKSGKKLIYVQSSVLSSNIFIKRMKKIIFRCEINGDNDGGGLTSFSIVFHCEDKAKKKYDHQVSSHCVPVYGEEAWCVSVIRFMAAYH